MPAVQVLEAQGFTQPELRWQLSRIRGRRVPPSTLRHWLRELCIQPDMSGLYSADDLHVLTRLVLWLKRKRTIQQFKTLLLQEIATHAD